MSYMLLIFLYYNNAYKNNCVSLYKFRKIRINIKINLYVLKIKIKIFQMTWSCKVWKLYSYCTPLGVSLIWFGLTFRDIVSLIILCWSLLQSSFNLLKDFNCFPILYSCLEPSNIFFSCPLTEISNFIMLGYHFLKNASVCHFILGATFKSWRSLTPGAFLAFLNSHSELLIS